jgi:hypothetical protein
VKGEAAALSVRAQRCQSHYFSATPRIPDDVLIQLILLMMSTGLLETCREVKKINTLKKCVKLVINKKSQVSFVIGRTKKYSKLDRHIVITVIAHFLQ